MLPDKRSLASLQGPSDSPRKLGRKTAEDSRLTMLADKRSLASLSNALRLASQARQKNGWGQPFHNVARQALAWRRFPAPSDSPRKLGRKTAEDSRLTMLPDKL